MASVEKPGAYHRDNADKWRRCRDFVSGADAVKSAGGAYVPRPSGLDNEEFRDYIARGSFFNATQRTVDSLIGLVMAKPPKSEMAAGLETLALNIDGAGSTAENFARDVVADVLTVGGGCAVVDQPNRPEGIQTRDQERAAGLRPYATVRNGDLGTGWAGAAGTRNDVEMAISLLAHRYPLAVLEG